MRLKSLRTGKVIPHLVNINKLKRVYCQEEDQEEEVVDEQEAPEAEVVENPENQENPPRNSSDEDLELRLSEEDSEDDKDSSEKEEEIRGNRKHAEPKGGSGMRSQKGDGASTREQTQAGGWGPPGVERDHADMDHLPTHSTPLVKEKTFLQHRERSGKVTVRNAGQGRVTTTPGKPKSSSDVVTSGSKPLSKGSTMVDKSTKRNSLQLKEASGENPEDSQKSETP